MKILVTGAGGQLSSELEVLSQARPQDEFVFLSIDQLDITNKNAVGSVFDNHRPDYCINAAAYTAVDKAETDSDTAFKVNADATQFLAEASVKAGARFVHISTDYVFEGNGTRPYREDDATAPQSVYGASKREGEERCLAADPNAIIIRTAWVYSSFGHNFVKTMLRLMPEKESLSIVSDQHGCPTYAADLAAAILFIIDSGKWIPGIYHYSNSNPTTWFDFAEAIRSHYGFSCRLIPISTDQYPTPAKRPAYSVLDTSKIRATFGLPVRSWQVALNDCLQSLDHTR
jgi:dTDP-4-dehydrorhamnose reductase